MSLHASFQYVKYKWHAKTRHGIHSPFVYDFIENVLRPLRSYASVIDHKRLSPYQRLAERIVKYFHCDSIYYIAEQTKDTAAVLATAQIKGNVFVINDENAEKISVIGSKALQPESSIPSPNLLWIEHTSPLQWLRIFDKYKSRLLPYTIVAVSQIHKSKLHTACWRRLKMQPEVRMSIETYKLGLLFFRKEFKEKQDFILQFSPPKGH